MYSSKTLSILVNRLSYLAMNSTMNSKHAAGLIYGNRIVGMSINNSTKESKNLSSILDVISRQYVL